MSVMLQPSAGVGLAQAVSSRPDRRTSSVACSAARSRSSSALINLSVESLGEVLAGYFDHVLERSAALLSPHFDSDAE